MPKYKYTVIQRRRGEVVSTHHYERKSDALLEVAAAVSNCHTAELMDYTNWFMGWWNK